MQWQQSAQVGWERRPERGAASAGPSLGVHCGLPQQAAQLARAIRMPELREPVLARHAVLYVYSELDVLLLCLRHLRQLGYR